MNKFRFLTAGESHGPALTTIIEGVPAGLELTEEFIKIDLARRQRGYGRGGRMKIEKDYAQIKSGVRYGKTLGSPISLYLENNDWPNWLNRMSAVPVEAPVEALQMPRPGHADYAGMVKYRTDDLRNILERSSARETTMRVAVGAIAKKMLAEFGIKISSHVTRVASVKSAISALDEESGLVSGANFDIRKWENIIKSANESEMACADKDATEKMKTLIDKAQESGDSLGGKFEVVATGVPVGLGSHVHWDKRLDGIIAMAMISINAMKAVEFGIGTKVGEIPGSLVHDELFYEKSCGYYRGSNKAGGIEGGMTNGEPVLVRVSMKPLPTLTSPLRSVDAGTKEAKQAFRERADVCAVPAAAVVGEAMLAIVLVDALMEKLGGDSVDEMKQTFERLPHVPLGW
jgi:chorismate synthase